MKKLFFVALMLMICGIGSLRAEEALVLGNESMPFNGVVNGKNAGMTYEILKEAVKYGAPTFKGISNS